MDSTAVTPPLPQATPAPVRGSPTSPPGGDRAPFAVSVGKLCTTTVDDAEATAPLWAAHAGGSDTHPLHLPHMTSMVSWSQFNLVAFSSAHGALKSGIPSAGDATGVEHRIYILDVRIPSHHTVVHTPHKSTIRFLVWSGDGRRLLSGDGADTICVWSVGKHVTLEHQFTVPPVVALRWVEPRPAHSVTMAAENDSYTSLEEKFRIPESMMSGRAMPLRYGFCNFISVHADKTMQVHLKRPADPSWSSVSCVLGEHTDDVDHSPDDLSQPHTDLFNGSSSGSAAAASESRGHCAMGPRDYPVCAADVVMSCTNGCKMVVAIGCRVPACTVIVYEVRVRPDTRQLISRLRCRQMLPMRGGVLLARTSAVVQSLHFDDTGHEIIAIVGSNHVPEGSPSGTMHRLACNAPERSGEQKGDYTLCQSLDLGQSEHGRIVCFSRSANGQLVLCGFASGVCEVRDAGSFRLVDTFPVKTDQATAAPTGEVGSPSTTPQATAAPPATLSHAMPVSAAFSANSTCAAVLSLGSQLHIVRLGLGVHVSSSEQLVLHLANMFEYSMLTRRDWWDVIEHVCGLQELPHTDVLVGVMQQLQRDAGKMDGTMFQVYGPTFLSVTAALSAMELRTATQADTKVRALVRFKRVTLLQQIAHVSDTLRSARVSTAPAVFHPKAITYLQPFAALAVDAAIYVLLCMCSPDAAVATGGGDPMCTRMLVQAANGLFRVLADVRSLVAHDAVLRVDNIVEMLRPLCLSEKHTAEEERMDAALLGVWKVLRTPAASEIDATLLTLLHQRRQHAQLTLDMEHFEQSYLLNTVLVDDDAVPSPQRRRNSVLGKRSRNASVSASSAAAAAVSTATTTVTSTAPGSSNVALSATGSIAAQHRYETLLKLNKVDTITLRPLEWKPKLRQCVQCGRTASAESNVWAKRWELACPLCNGRWRLVERS